MKKLTILSSFLVLSISILKAQEPERSTVTDIEGNIYKTILIGNYEWMAENLKTNIYNNGTKIPYVIEDIAWPGLRSDAYCFYNNNKSNVSTYGALYNWYAVNTGNLCPAGWHVPTDEEWKYLEGYADSRYGVGDSVWDNTGFRGSDAGQRLKAALGWKPGVINTNDFGFSALPGGERLCRNGRFFIIGYNGFWWSCNESDSSDAWYRSMIYAYEDIFRGRHDKRFAFSVRCLRNK